MKCKTFKTILNNYKRANLYIENEGNRIPISFVIVDGASRMVRFISSKKYNWNTTSTSILKKLNSIGITDNFTILFEDEYHKIKFLEGYIIKPTDTEIIIQK